jgi:hypothetical protein
MRSQINRSARRAGFAAPALVAVALIIVGCSQLDVGRAWPWSPAKSDKPEPGRMTVAWTHATETESGREMRGFRGRIFFYPKEKSTSKAKEQSKDSQKPMKVEGTLTVYGFDVTAAGKLSPGAPRKFLFVPDKFKKQCSESKQGPSYNVWLPWDGVGGPPTQINLWTRFDAVNNGPVVTSENSRQLLPGVPTQIAAGRKPLLRQSPIGGTPRGPIEQTGYETSVEPATGRGAEPRTSDASNADWWK